MAIYFILDFQKNLKIKSFKKMQRVTYLALFAQNGTNKNFIGISSFAIF